jgi:hypothetical protein
VHGHGGNMAQPRSLGVLAFDFRTRESVRPSVRLRAWPRAVTVS